MRVLVFMRRPSLTEDSQSSGSWGFGSFSRQAGGPSPYVALFEKWSRSTQSKSKGMESLGEGLGRGALPREEPSPPVAAETATAAVVSNVRPRCSGEVN